jgi:hypothetical protein
MQRIGLRACVGLILLGAAGSARADEPRAVVERAIKAMGAQTLNHQSPAIHLKVKGNYYDMEVLSLTAEVWQQFPGQQKVTMHIRGPGQDFVMTLIQNGSSAWETLSDESQPADSATLVDLKEDGYRDWVNSLLPLLREKDFSLRSDGEKTVEGKPATVIAVQSKDHPPIRLYFDKTTSLLVKSEQRRRQAGKGPEVLLESYFSDYREVLSSAGDEKTLKDAGIASDGTALVAFLKKHTLDDAARVRITELVRKLGDSSFETRERAKDDLIALGEPAAPFLSQAVHDPDPEISSRARECLDKVGKGQARPGVLMAVLRLIAQRQPDDAAAALLSYLPCAPNDVVVQAAQGALVAVARQNSAGKRVLVGALESKDPGKRQAAELALGRRKTSGPEQPHYLLLLPGLKQAMKETSYRDGKKVTEVEVLSYELYTRLPDKEFGKP